MSAKKRPGEFLISEKKSKIRKSDASFSTESEENHSSYEDLPSFMKSFSSFFDDDDIPHKAETKYQRYSTDDTDNNSEFMQDSLKQSEESKSFFDVTKKRQVVLVNSSSPVQLFGHLKLNLIVGKASVCGYDLKRRKPVTIFSNYKTGLLVLESKSNDKEFSINNLLRIISGLIALPSLINIKDFLKNNLQNSAAVVLVEELGLPPPMKFLKLYLPQAVSFRNLKNFESVYVSFESDYKPYFKITKEYESIYTSTVKHLFKTNKEYATSYKNSVFSETESSDSEMDYSEEEKDIRTGYRIFVTGPQKSGKSSFLRYLINKFLNSYQEVYYLDTDPGQTEFTPPGVVSLSRITEPVFGAPYTHQRTPLKMVFIGTIAPETSPKMCTESVKYLLKYFNKYHPKSILLVNTMSLYEGIGDMIIEVIKDYVKPTVEINLHPYLKLEKTTVNKERGFLKINAAFDFDALEGSSSNHKPSALREFALIAHLGMSIGHYRKVTYINERRPYCIRWGDIAVYNFNKKLPYSEYYESLIGSIVGLCNVKQPYLLKSTNPEYPDTVVDDHINECLGFGLVTCGDIAQRIFFLVTPLKLETLKRVNVLMAGNILVPQSMILKQPLPGVELPYTDSAIIEGTSGRKFVEKCIPIA